MYRKGSVPELTVRSHVVFNLRQLRAAVARAYDNPVPPVPVARTATASGPATTATRASVVLHAPQATPQGRVWRGRRRVLASRRVLEA